jgi:hypothetical protein
VSGLAFEWRENHVELKLPQSSETPGEQTKSCGDGKIDA